MSLNNKIDDLTITQLTINDKFGYMSISGEPKLRKRSHLSLALTVQCHSGEMLVPVYIDETPLCLGIVALLKPNQLQTGRHCFETLRTFSGIFENKLY